MNDMTHSANHGGMETMTADEGRECIRDLMAWWSTGISIGLQLGMTQSQAEEAVGNALRRQVADFADRA